MISSGQSKDSTYMILQGRETTVAEPKANLTGWDSVGKNLSEK